VIKSQSRQSRRIVPTQRSANAFAFGARNGADDLDALASKRFVEGAAELAVAVVESEADRRHSFRE
jgi:hypothetical protein